MKNANQRDHTTAHWISVLNRLLGLYAGRSLGSHGIGAGKFLYLSELFLGDGLSQEELSTLLRVDKSNTTRALTRLEKDGFVRRKRCTKDRRVIRVYLTDKARTIEKKTKMLLTTWNETLCRGFSESEKEFLEKSLKRMADNAQQALWDKEDRL